MLKSLATIAGLSLAVAAGTAASDEIQPHQFKVLGRVDELTHPADKDSSQLLLVIHRITTNLQGTVDVHQDERIRLGSGA